MSAHRGGYRMGEILPIGVKQTKRDFGRIDILVNNAAEQHPTEGHHEDQGEPASTVRPTIPQIGKDSRGCSSARGAGLTRSSAPRSRN